MKASDVRTLVHGYQPLDSSEHRFHERLSKLVDDFDDPWNRERYEPGHLTASAFLLNPGRTATALVHHAKLDMWVQPGGHVEHHDLSHRDAALREVAEECLVTDVDSLGPIDLDIHRFPQRGAQPEHLHFDLRWAFVARDDRIGAGDGTLDVRWFPLVEVVDMDESVARAARKLLDYADRS